jgi:hypothetical protein
MWGSHFSFSYYEKENPMTKFTLFGVAVVLSSALAGPAMAQHIVAHPNHYAQNDSCLNREPGNPYNKAEDYMGWSAWRDRGGWDDRNDWRCTYGIRSYRHEVGF